MARARHRRAVRIAPLKAAGGRMRAVGRARYCPLAWKAEAPWLVVSSWVTRGRSLRRPTLS